MTAESNSATHPSHRIVQLSQDLLTAGAQLPKGSGGVPADLGVCEAYKQAIDILLDVGMIPD